MCFNRTDIWGGETTFMVGKFLIHSKFASNKPLKCRPYVYEVAISIAIYILRALTSLKTLNKFSCFNSRQTSSWFPLCRSII